MVHNQAVRDLVWFARNLWHYRAGGSSEKQQGLQPESLKMRIFGTTEVVPFYKTYRWWNRWRWMSAGLVRLQLLDR